MFFSEYTNFTKVHVFWGGHKIWQSLTVHFTDLAWLMAGIKNSPKNLYSHVIFVVLFRIATGDGINQLLLKIREFLFIIICLLTMRSALAVRPCPSWFVFYLLNKQKFNSRDFIIFLWPSQNKWTLPALFLDDMGSII